MPGLTVTEKSHWRDRIAARIDRAVARIEAMHPMVIDRIKREAHRDALESLGLTALHAELATIEAEEEALARREKRTQRAMLAAIRNMPIEDVDDGFCVRHGSDLPMPYEVGDAIVKRQSTHRDQLLADDPIGREIARLQIEKEGLLDTVWLATSPSAIKQLWSRVAALLGDEPTSLERDALTIAPIESE